MRPFLRALLGLLVLVSAACSPRETPADAGLRSHTLLIGNQNEPATLDPQLADAYTDQIISVALFEGLTVLDEATNHALPGVATSWDMSPDSLVYTFHLRAEARWSNGDPVTARDFAFSFQRILSPNLAASYSYMLWPIKNAAAYNRGELKDFPAVGVEVVDDRTLRITLERPTPYLPVLAAHPTWMPLHRASLERHGAVDDRSDPWARPGRLVSNGPFALADWSLNARLTVARNPHYWDNARTALERVVFFPIENAETEDHNFRAGQLHLTYDVPKAKLAAYRAESPALVRVDPLLSLYYLNFNTTKPPFNDPRVRRAFALVVDADALAHHVLQDAFAPARSIVPPHCGDYTPRATNPTDPAEARRLLAEAGFPEGRGFPVVPFSIRNDVDQSHVAEALQAMWQRELGVRVTIEPSEQKTWLQRQQSMQHTFGILGWAADFADPVTFLDNYRTGNGQNWTGWGDPAYDALMDRAAATADPAARLEFFREAEARLLAAAPAAPLLFRARTYLISPMVKNWEPAPLGLHRFQLVRLEK